MAIPTFPAPITEILLWRLVGDGGAAFEIGLKNAWVKSRPPGPNVEAEPVLCMMMMMMMMC
jgi:hypothetical protein